MTEIKMMAEKNKTWIFLFDINETKPTIKIDTPKAEGKEKRLKNR